MVFNICFLTVSAQVTLPEQVKDFGTLRRADPNWVDFEIRNAGPTDAVIFRVTGPKNTDIKLSAKTIKAGTSEFIRVAVSPISEGKFSEKLEVHVSAWQKPQRIEVKGESTFAASSLIPCPDFSGSAENKGNTFFVSVRDFDQNPLEKAHVNIYKDSRKVEELKTNEHGEASLELPYGRYFFSIRNEGYSLDTAMYVNAINNHLLAMVEVIPVERDENMVVEELAKIETEIPVPPTPPISPEVPKKREVTEVLDVPEVQEVPEVAFIDPSEDTPLPLSRYKKNNLVFLIDISASMKQQGRMDLLKIAMVELLDILRPYDKFSLITYASGTDVIMEATENLDKDACIEAILALEPKGSTEGAKAINKAGQIALKNFVEDGNNQIIMATDGAFNEGVDQALKYVSKYDRKNVHLSVLGIKCGGFTTKQMQTLVDQGRGRYIPVDDAGDAGQKLIEEVKKSSVR